MQITSTQLLEWVKDGDINKLKKDFEEELKFAHKTLLEFFSMVDDQSRSVVYWGVKYIIK
ncbi:unnamed protein product [Paramecium primaurelia]|uniref:Uncharacterized protein n=1 Tax=Paramecium primaurelia TaxID=5886 RepID=A0A8S1QPD6_PARPR|nr:unnamed protein product [Paramecium primaurelia]